MIDFKLCASLEGHEDDVRGVSFPRPDLVVSASRDATVRQWKLSPPSSEKPAPISARFDCTISSHGHAFINALTFVKPTKAFPDGLIVSGDKDGIIEARNPSRLSSDNADALLLGHSGNVCALDASEDGAMIVSGSWDGEGRVWQVGKWETTAVLQGHGQSVWTVLVYGSDSIITGCADKLIRVFHPSGKLLRTIRGSEDVVRALCKLPQSHPSGAQFASAGNDAVVRLWTLEGAQIAQLYGHENFIYSLATLPTGEIASSSEDRTVRIWNGAECVQTITHPAISVWSVAVCWENGDIVTGSSDKIVRIFSREKERHGDPAVVGAFEEAVKASAIPEQALGGINKTDLPGPEFLHQKSGTKEGQVQMIKESNGSVGAYQWSTAASQWLSVGTVVDAAGSGNKISYNGKDYDYVWDVDIEEGKPPLKLPFNVTQNPYEVARKFIEDHKLPITYLDQVTNFIVQNSQGASVGQQTSAASDPWGTGARYRPGDEQAAAQTSAPSPSPAPKILPQKDYLAISTGNHQAILKKLQEFNAELVADGRKDLSLNPSSMSLLTSTMAKLTPVAGSTSASLTFPSETVSVAMQLATIWPMEKRLPGLDFLRLLTAASASPVDHTAASPDRNIVALLAESGVFDPKTAPPNNTMMAVRVLANLFCSPSGRTLARSSFDQILGLVRAHSASANKNLIVALTTLYINLAVLLTSSLATSSSAPPSATAETAEDTWSSTSPPADRAIALLDALVAVLHGTCEPEALYRALVAVGTVVCLGPDFGDVAREGLGVEEAVGRAVSVAGEERVGRVGGEIVGYFGG